MKFMLKELVDMQPSLSRLLMVELPAKTSFKLGRFVKKMASELDEYEKQRLALLKKFAITKEDGETLETDEYNRAIFSKKDDELTFKSELNQLLELEVDIPFEQISLEDLGGVSISGAVLLGVSRLFKDFEN